MVGGPRGRVKARAGSGEQIDDNGAGMRSLSLLLCLLPLKACASLAGDLLHGVARSCPAPAAFDPAAAEGAARRHPQLSAGETRSWNGQELWVVVREGDARAGFAFANGQLQVSSGWMNRVPEPSALEQSLGLQRELIDLLRARFPGLPGVEQWSVHWSHLEPPPAAGNGR